jgi:Domain of unknown function (DUF4187)
MDYDDDSFLAAAKLEDARRAGVAGRGRGTLGGSRRRPAAVAVFSRQGEAARREAGLATEIDASNKGFQMLAKMGFRPGDRVGAERPTEEAGSAAARTATELEAPLSAPLKIVKRPRNAGLGTFEKEAASNKRPRGAESGQASGSGPAGASSPPIDLTAHTAQFRRQQVSRFDDNAASRSLRKAVGILRTFEETRAEEEDKDKERSTADPASAAGVGPDDEGDERRDFVANCPLFVRVADSDNEGSEPEEGFRAPRPSVIVCPGVVLAPAIAELPQREQVLAVLERLRGEFDYCLYCGTFLSARGLKCPGVDEEAHEV